MDAQQIFEYIVPVAVSALSALFAYGAKLLREKSKSALLQRAFIVLDDVAMTAVREVAQLYVDEVRKARADGFLSDDEKAAAKAKALAKAKELLGASGLALIKAAFGVKQDEPSRVDALLGARIESEVRSARPFA